MSHINQETDKLDTQSHNERNAVSKPGSATETIKPTKKSSLQNPSQQSLKSGSQMRQRPGKEFNAYVPSCNPWQDLAEIQMENNFI